MPDHLRRKLAGMAAHDADPAPYQVVARRFRPRTFGEVVGQEVILQSLRSALQSGRIPHALLFSGSRGVGKTTLARIFARCLNCQRGPTAEPCDRCDLCRSILDGSNTDVVEMDAASNNSVEDVRALRESVGFVAMRSRFRVFILDEAHMLSKAAFNAFLKTLEEPPPNVVFVLATTELGKIPETIRSRCQVLQFRRVNDADIAARLRMIADAEQVALPDAVLEEIAASCRGGMRDAETALERVLPVARELGSKFDLAAFRDLVQRVGVDRAVDVAAELLQGRPGAALAFAAELQQSGADEREALGDLLEVLRWCLLLKVDGPDSGLVPATGGLRQRLVALAEACDEPALEAAIQAAILGRDRLRRLEDRAIVLELTLVRIAGVGRLRPLADLLAEVRSGAAAVPARAPAAPPVRGAAGARPTAPATPATPAPPPGAPPAGDLRGSLLQQLGSSRQLLKATLELCTFHGPDGNGIVRVKLDSDRRMHRDRLASPGVQQEVRELIAETLGKTVQVAFDVAGGGNGGPDPQTPRSAAPPVGPAAQRVIGRFGGRVVARNPEDRAPPSAPAGAEDGPPPDSPDP